MTDHRPLGVELIAGYFCLKAAMLPMAVAIAHMSPELQPAANELISHLSPIIHGFRIWGFEVFLALPFALLRLAVGLGIWFLKRWARTIIVLDLLWFFCRAAVGLGILLALDHKLPPLASSPYLAVDIVISASILVYLLDPEVKRTFGIRE